MSETRKNDSSIHEPVMVEEVLSYLKPAEIKNGTFIDGTTSTGGHAIEISQRLGSDGMLIGLDLDSKGLEVANERLSGTPPRIKLYQANYKEIELTLEATGEPGADGVLFDLGFSSFQIDNPARGFSFQKDGPLDMRMDPDCELTAEEVVNEYSFENLKRIIRKYGEEGWADGITKEIVKQRQKKRITTTGELKEIIEAAIPEGVKGRRKNNPATKTFQALRIAVNDELTNLNQGLKSAFNCLKKGGRMVVISYHSLEDRKVKRFLAHKEKNCVCPPELPVCRCEKEQELEILSPGVVRPTEQEIKKNPRSRSALLRAANGKR